ncbi:MAG: hypothetical protein ABI423_11905, partial [Burkholderiales bacterium]
MSEIQFDVGGMPFPDAPLAGTTGAPGGAPATGGEDVLGEIVQRQGDSAFMEKYLSGDAAAVAQMKALYERAFPEPQQDTAPGDGQAEAPALDPAADANSEFLAASMATAYQPPRGAWEYEGLINAQMSAEQVSAGMMLGEVLADMGMPVTLYNQLGDMGQRLQREGLSEDGEGEKARGQAELERRHG